MKSEKRKIFLDSSGTVLKPNDKIMYITDGISINYGIIHSFSTRKCVWRSSGTEDTIKVWKVKGGYLEEARFVTLSYPTLFKCEVELPFPTDTFVEGMND